MIVISNGIISVVRNRMNSVRRKGNCKKANAYPAHVAMASCPIVTNTVTTALLARYRARCPSLQAPELQHREEECHSEQGDGQHSRFAVVLRELQLIVDVVNEHVCCLQRSAPRREQVDLPERLEGKDRPDDEREEDRRREQRQRDPP